MKSYTHLKIGEKAYLDSHPNMIGIISALFYSNASKPMAILELSPNDGFYNPDKTIYIGSMVCHQDSLTSVNQ